MRNALSLRKEVKSSLITSHPLIIIPIFIKFTYLSFLSVSFLNIYYFDYFLFSHRRIPLKSMNLKDEQKWFKKKERERKFHDRPSSSLIEVKSPKM